MIRAAETCVSIQERCRMLHVARSGYYAWCRRPVSRRAEQDQVLLERIRAIHAETAARYGTPRVHRELRAEGLRCGAKRVKRLRRAAGLRAEYPRPYRVTTRGTRAARAANQLAQRFAITDQPGLNRTWSADLTYLWTGEGWLFLAVILDLASRRIVGWALRPRMDQVLTLNALRMALTHRHLDGRAPRLHHSDRGVQYTAEPYQRALATAGFTPSLSRHGNCYDNAVSESFFATLRKELVHRVNFPTRDVAHREVIGFIEGWYNRRRRHSSLDYSTPVEFEDKFERES
jgi:transposase InsO family protein